MLLVTRFWNCFKYLYDIAHYIISNYLLIICIMCNIVLINIFLRIIQDNILSKLTIHYSGTRMLYSTANWFLLFLLVYFLQSVYARACLNCETAQRTNLQKRYYASWSQCGPSLKNLLLRLPLNSYILPNKYRTALQNGSNTILVNGWRVWSNEKVIIF